MSPMSFSPSPPLRLLIGLGLVGCLPAAELVMRDLQADLTVLPTAFAYEITSPTVNASGDDSFRSGTGLMFGGRRSITRAGDAIGLVVGADLLSNTWTYGDSGYLWGYGLHATAGVGWAINDRWTLVLEPGIGIGLDSLSLAGNRAGPGLESSGRWMGWDIRCAAGWQVSERVVVRASVGWMTATFDQQDADGVSGSLTPTGVTVGLGIAWRLSNAPETLR